MAPILVWFGKELMGQDTRTLFWGESSMPNALTSPSEYRATQPAVVASMIYGCSRAPRVSPC